MSEAGNTNNQELRFHAIGVDRLRVINDGAGITTLVAGYGCPLRCKYCLNPQCFEQKHPVKSYTISELLEEVAVDDLYFQATGGGIVFGGGEPLLQADFIHAFRAACPKEWKLYLESSLAVPEKELLKIIDDIDFFLIDIKDMDPEIYSAYTGRQPDRMLRNLKLLADHEKADKTTLRIPLIPDFNDDNKRKQSVEQLRQIGFSGFDLFEYNVSLAFGKRI